MRYMGGKSRIAKIITTLMLELSDNREVYVEPFFGGGAVGTEMAPHFGDIYISDFHEDLMMMWNAVINEGWMPPTEVSYELYQELRYSTEASPLRGFVGYACSFGGRWFEGYARYEDTNFAKTGHNVVLKQAAKLAGAKAFSSSYDSLPGVPALPLIYCDPPYENTKGYSSTSSFEHKAFWKKAQGWAEMGADVFVSEYNAPKGWIPVWEKEVTGQLDPRKDRTKPIEKLFIWGNSGMAQRFLAREQIAA